MATLIPKQIPEENWKKLESHKAYAFRSIGSDIRLRFGAGGLYVAISESGTGESIVNSIGLEDGMYSVLGKISQGNISVMGRASDSNIHASFPIVSRKHLEFYLKGNVIVIKDLGSTNGTFCHTDNFHFDIDAYLDRRPSKKASENTMDEVHEEFGPTIDDFLKTYTEKFKKG